MALGCKYFTECVTERIVKVGQYFLPRYGRKFAAMTF